MVMGRNNVNNIGINIVKMSVLPNLNIRVNAISIKKTPVSYIVDIDKIHSNIYMERQRPQTANKVLKNKVGGLILHNLIPS